MDGVVDISSRVVGHLRRHPGREFLFDLFQFHPHALDDVHRICIWQDPNAHEDGLLPRKANLGVVVFCPEDNVSDVAQSDECALVLPDHELFELFCRMQIGIRSEIDLKQRSFGAADGGEIIISRKRVSDIGRANVQCGHAFRFHPNAHSKGSPPENIGFLYATNRSEPRLNEANEIIRNLVRLQNVRCETQISGSKLRIGGLDCDYRDLGFGR